MYIRTIVATFTSRQHTQVSRVMPICLETALVIELDETNEVIEKQYIQLGYADDVLQRYADSFWSNSHPKSPLPQAK